MKITVDSPFPGVWQACDQDSVDGEYIDGVAHCTGMIAHGKTRQEALAELRWQYEERLAYPDDEEDSLEAAQAIAEIDRQLALHNRAAELRHLAVEACRPFR